MAVDAAGNGDAARQRVRQKKSKRLKRDASDVVKRAPVRTCVGCGATDQAEEMLRVAFAPAEGTSPDGTSTGGVSAGGASANADVGARLLIDVHGKRSFQGNVGGRGAWVHARPQCIQTACSKGFSRAFKEPLKLESSVFYRRLQDVTERQLEGLVLAAWRSRRLVYGGEAVKEALPEAALGVLARDARSVGKETFVQEAAQSGKMLMWSTKITAR